MKAHHFLLALALLAACTPATKDEPQEAPQVYEVFFIQYNQQFDIWAASTTTDGLRQVTKDTAAWEYKPLYVSHLGKVLYIRAQGDSSTIMQMNPDGSQQQPATLQRADFYRYAPDGSWVLFAEEVEAGNSEVFIMRPDGSERRNLSNNPGLDDRPVWSPDGKHIAFISNRPADDTPAPDGPDDEAWLLELATGQLTQLTHNTTRDKYLDWAQQGGYIAFTTELDAVGMELFRIRPDGTGLQRLTNNAYPEEEISVSPDGAWIAVHSRAETGELDDEGQPKLQHDIFLISADGRTRRRLTHTPYYKGEPCWVTQPQATP